MTISETEDSAINIYYNEDIIACHHTSNKKYNYHHNHLHEILKSDALKNMSDIQINDFIVNNLSMMDIFLEE